MAIQNKKSCLCGNSFGRYGAANSSSCVSCSGYNCGGPNVNGIHLLNFFELTLICPLVVSPGQEFTCWGSISYNFHYTSFIDNPLIITVYPFYTNYLRAFNISVPTSVNSSESFDSENTIVFSFNYTYSASSPTRTMYLFAPSYSTAYAYQTIYVNSSINIVL